MKGLKEAIKEGACTVSDRQAIASNSTKATLAGESDYS